MERGFVVYSNAAKQDLLGVPEEMLKENGAVSEPVVRAMLEGALARSEAGIGLAITGIAGPDGGTPSRPVGTVWIAWGAKDRICAETHRFLWDRDYNRILSAWTAMFRVYEFVRGRQSV
jgi:PncC family amidohydrolase